MANGRPGDWRNPAGGKPTAPKADVPRTSRRGWQPGGDAQTPAGKKRSRGSRLAVAGLITALLVGVTVWVIWLFWPARYPQLAIAGPIAAESLALPGDPAGANAAADLAAWATDGRDADHPKLDQTAVVSVDGSGAKITIDPNPKNLVVYISTSGGADAKGAYLWVASQNARSTAEAQKLPVRDILDRVSSARRGKPTLLVFDCTRVSMSWPHGILLNDFARALKELDGEIAKIPGLAVICASDEDQRSGLFEERRVSAFAFYFLEGLKGAGHSRGARVTAASAFDQAKGEVERWAIANRNEKQTPILLPVEEGRGRAEHIDLAAAPATGYQNPAPPEVPANVPGDLEEAWKIANQIAAQVPPPEANTPGVWCEYLDLLLRWEQLFRLGANTNAVRERVTALATQLRNPTVGRELAAVPTAIPAARALGRPPAFADARAADQFRAAFFSKVWSAPTPADRTDGWAGLLRTNAGRETAIRTAAADLVLTRLIEDGPNAESLRTAGDVLATTHGNAGLPAPAEAHFVRLLSLYLSEPAKSQTALLKQAIALRRDAEDAAWVFMALPTEYPYPEGVFPWVSAHIEAGDHNRQLGQDLLFSSDPKDWKEAEGYFEKARADYARARADGRKVAAALAARDRVFARLPYYARWLAAYRGNRTQAQLDQLLDHADTAARKAHDIQEMTAKNPPPLDQLNKLDALRAEVDGHFKAIVTDFDTDIAALADTALPSNWHALDSALTVPFIPSRRRAELLGFLRHVSHQLEVNRQQPDGSKVPPPQTREVAAREGRMALALLNDQSADHRQLLERPEQAWWNSYRTLGDQIGDGFRGLAGVAKGKGDEATRTATLKEAGPPLAAAALSARLADAAAPMLAGSDPVATELQFRRHGLLLWQAERVTREGWADVARTTPDGWYCRKVAALLVSSADGLIRETAAELAGRPVENMSPGELDRWLADSRAEAARRPVVLDLRANREQEIADEPSWEFALTVSAKEADRLAVGFPVTWLTAPPEPYPQPQPGTIGRRIETAFIRGVATTTRLVRFTAVAPPRDLSASGRLTSTVLYRGHLYQTPTEVTLVGTPTREWVYTPPSGPAAFAVRAGQSDVAGAVTILIDLTRSMNLRLNESDSTSSTRIQEAKKGLERILKDLPKGAMVTLAYFYGNGKIMTVEPAGKPLLMDGTNWETAYNQFKNMKADGENTPLAGAIREVLDKANVKKFWPADFTGSRTLMVLTDGEDNWEPQYKEEAGDVALNALRKAQIDAHRGDDVNLHIIFFGATTAEAKEEEKRATKQFEVLRQPDRFRDPPGVPAQLWPGIHDANALADLCRRAMLPQFPYSGEKRLADRIEATIPEEGVVRATTPVQPGVYDLWGLRGPQALQLRPGDRVLLQARRDKPNERFELYLPTYGYEIAQKEGRPYNSTGNAATAGIRGTIPALKLVNGSNYADLNAVMTLEPIGERKAANLLEVTRPQFVWFDANYDDGKPAEKGLNPCIKIENRSPTWAPAWNLTVSRWAPAGADLKTVRHPALTGYWLDGFPLAAASFPVNLNDLTGSWDRLEKFRTVRVRDTDVALLSISREQYSAPGLPDGVYLTVRFKYGKPGEFVFLRPGNLKGPNQPYVLHERHVYYDAQARYTVRFGPLFDTDQNKDITLDLYSVADLKEASAKASRSVEVRLPVGPLPTHILPQDLEIQPRTK